jgi:hypothetical protein
MNRTTKRGFVYVATGAAYVAEALRSAASLRVLHPDANIDLITDSPPAESNPFSCVRRPIGPVERAPIDKLLAYEAPYDEIVFLDTDTYITGDLTPIFDLLAMHDMALLQDVNRGWNYELPGLPLTFSEFNTGVLAFRKSPLVEKFFATWRSSFRSLREELSRQGQPPLSDQPSLRYCLFHSSIRVAPLPNEFHFLANYPNSTMWNVRLFHGRGDLPRIAAEVNARPGLRVFLPYAGCLSEFKGKRKFLHEFFRFLLRAWHTMLHALEDPSRKVPYNWHHVMSDPSEVRPTSQHETIKKSTGAA